MENVDILMVFLELVFVTNFIVVAVAVVVTLCE